MDYSALDTIARVAGEYKAAGKQFHLRYLDVKSYRLLAKGRHMLKDVSTWRVRSNPAAPVPQGFPPMLPCPDQSAATAFAYLLLPFKGREASG
jgi:hypothetical protein